MTPQAHACICEIPSDQAQQEYDQAHADAIFVGEVREVGSGGRAWVQVYGSWRGLPEETVMVKVDGGRGSCAYFFAKDAIYLIYAYRQSGARQDAYRITACNATTPLKDAQEALQALGKPEWGRVPDS